MRQGADIRIGHLVPDWPMAIQGSADPEDFARVRSGRTVGLAHRGMLGSTHCGWRVTDLVDAVPTQESNKQDNCQVAVSVSLACEEGSLPVAWRLYLPHEWADDAARREKAEVPTEVRFATKPQIALQQLEALLAEGAPRYCVLADAGYGVDTAFRLRLSELGMPYMVGITSAVVVWSPGIEPLPAQALQRQRAAAGNAAPRRQPMSVKALASGLPPGAFQTISWREGTNETLSSRFGALRVRRAGGNSGRARLQPQEWLLIEWPAGQDEPTKYWLSTLPEDAAINDLVNATHLRWRIERDYQDLKQELGLGHYEGRGWRGFHHHASLCIVAYGYLMAQRLTVGIQTDGKKTSPNAKCLPFPRITSPAAALRAQRHVPDSIPSLRHRLSYGLIDRMGLCPCCGKDRRQFDVMTRSD